MLLRVATRRDKTFLWKVHAKRETSKARQVHSTWLSGSETLVKRSSHSTGYDRQFYDNYKALQKYDKAINITASVSMEEYLKQRIELESANRLLSKYNDGCREGQYAITELVKEVNELTKELNKSDAIGKTKEMKRFTLILDLISNKYSCISKKIYFECRRHNSHERVWEIKYKKSIDYDIDKHNEATSSLEEDMYHCDHEISKLDDQCNRKVDEVRKKMGEL